MTIKHLLQDESHTSSLFLSVSDDFRAEQLTDPNLAEMIGYLQCQTLQEQEARKCLVVSKSHNMILDKGTLYLMDWKGNKRAVVLEHLRQSLLEQAHGGRMAGHFAVKHLHGALAKMWWWQGMYTDAKSNCRNCPQCAIVKGSGNTTSQTRPSTEAISSSQGQHNRSPNNNLHESPGCSLPRLPV